VIRRFGLGVVGCERFHDFLVVFFANSFLYCRGQDVGGAVQILSARTRAQTFGMPFLEQSAG
jgi:hypothetical protein